VLREQQDQSNSRNGKMQSFNARRAVSAALIGMAMLGTTGIARADIKDYEFQLVDQTIQAGSDKIITVRLVNRKTGKPVPDAVIFATRLDMAPDGMQEMATKVTPMPGGEPGLYKFKATLGMAGRWQLSLGAKVQGETGAVENKLVVTAQK
jgi:YtkA-like protein